MRTIIRMLHEAAERYPGRSYTAKKTDEGWKGWTFKDTDDESDKIAAALIKLGFSHDSKAAILAEGRPEWITGEFGVIKAACTSVPLSIKLSYEEIAFRVNHSEAKGFFVSSNTIQKVISAWPHLDKPPLIFYLDDEDKNFRKAGTEVQAERGKSIFTWQDLLDMGTEELEKEPTKISDIEPTIDENDVVNICYTSGTTGNPKGIMLTHLNYWTNAHDGVDLFTLPDATFTTLVILPLDHSFAHTVGTYASLLRGITMHFVDAKGGSMNIIRNIPKNLVETNPTFLMTVPSLSGNFMKKISAGVAKKGKLINGIFTAGVNAGIRINGDGYNRPGWWTRFVNFWPHKLASMLVFPKVRKIFGDNILYCVGGGALLEVRQQNFFASIGVPIYQGYGLTEAAPIICSNTPNKHKFGTSGVIAPSVECRIMKSVSGKDNKGTESVSDKDNKGTEETWEEAAVGERGEIVIRGDNVMKGYFKNEKASNEVLRDGWLWTGDLGYYDEDGFLVVTGRAKALLIAPDGEKFSPEEVEEAIINHSECVSQVLVYNDHKMFTSGLITLNTEKVREMIADAGIPLETESEAAGSSGTEDAAPAGTEETAVNKVLALIHDDIYRFKREEPGLIPAQWVPATFEIIPKEFSEEDNLINSTMKMVRYKVIEFYNNRIDKMYEDKNFYNERNREAVRELFFTKSKKQ